MPTPDDGPTDRSLLRRFRRGQEDASTLLYLRYAGRLHALAARQSGADLARRLDPEDIVQSVFRTFFRRAARGEYEVPDGEEIWRLLLVIALNKVRAAAVHHRAAKRDAARTVGGEGLAHSLASEADRDEQALTVLRLVVDEALTKLPEAQRRMI